MTPYTQEVEEALKWADTFGKWEGVEGIPDRHCAVLAAELRRQSQELERARDDVRRWKMTHLLDVMSLDREVFKAAVQVVHCLQALTDPEGSLSAAGVNDGPEKNEAEQSLRDYDTALQAALTQPAPEKP